MYKLSFMANRSLQPVSRYNRKFIVLFRIQSKAFNLFSWRMIEPYLVRWVIYIKHRPWENQNKHRWPASWNSWFCEVGNCCEQWIKTANIVCFCWIDTPFIENKFVKISYNINSDMFGTKRPAKRSIIGTPVCAKWIEDGRYYPGIVTSTSVWPNGEEVFNVFISYFKLAKTYQVI